MKHIIKILIGILLLTSTACKKDNSKLAKTIDSKLVLASSVDNETGEMIGEGDTFVVMNDGWVEASLDLSKYFKKEKKNLMIHLDWVDELGNSFYKKMQILNKDSAKVNTAISISPELRKAGKYSVNVYAFRELVASKNFTLLPTYTFENPIKEKLQITTRANRKTTKFKSEKPTISLMEDKWVKASVKLKKLPEYKNQDLLYQFNWIDKNGEVFYKKRFSVPYDKKKSALDCSVEVAPAKKEVGDYKIQLLLYGEPIAETEFTLTPALDASKITAKTTLCKKVENNKPIEKTTSFTIKKKNKVMALFDLDNCLAFGKKEELNFKISWVGADGKPFYSKRFNFRSEAETKTLKSGISIPPKKRKPGKYKVQLYLYNQLLSASEFTLNEVSNKKKIETAITLYSEINKTTKKKVGVGDNFTLKDKTKVRAYVTVKNPEIYGKMKGLKFRFDWVGTNNKVFYSKKIEVLPFEAASGLESAISIPPKKRKPGTYKLRVYLFGKLVNEKEFTLSDS